MVPDLIWTLDFFGPQEIWSPRNWSRRNLGLKNVDPCMKMQYNDFYAGTKFCGPHFSQGLNFLGTKFLGDQKSQGPK